MKAVALILLFGFCSIDCRKVVPINKHANIDFINMESGGMRPQQPIVQPMQPAPPKAPAPAPTTPNQPAPVAPAPTTKPPTPAPAAKPAAPLPSPSKPAPAPSTPIKPVPVYPAPAAPVTTPGPGSVKSLVNFYNSNGNGSPIRPYSYSQAVKQG